uniref:Eukaryotic translation initiation factor 4E family member 2 n=1 Tax=Myripristis murdjan TaxID=586833 RepID=A0A667X779_9TELE
MWSVCRFCVVVAFSLKDDDSGDHDQDQGSPKDCEKEKIEDEDKEQNTAKKKVEQFWRFYSHMIRPGDLTGHSDFHLFKEGIKPMWEDDANKMGGKWIIRLRKGLASRCWENLILAMLGEQFMVGEEICGAVVSVRFQEDIISIWNKTASDQATTARIRDTLRRVLNLPPNTIMEYKTHTDSIKYVCFNPFIIGFLSHLSLHMHAHTHTNSEFMFSHTGGSMTHV